MNVWKKCLLSQGEENHIFRATYVPAMPKTDGFVVGGDVYCQQNLVLTWVE